MARLVSIFLVWVMAVLIVAPSNSLGESPSQLSYQAQLTDPNGRPLTATVVVEVAIWDSPQGGEQIYGEVHLTVAVLDGVLNLVIGAGDFIDPCCPQRLEASMFAGPNRFLELAIETEVLTPRQPFSSVGYAFHSDAATSAETARFADEAGTVGGLPRAQIATRTETDELQAELQQVLAATLRLCEIFGPFPFWPEECMALPGNGGSYGYYGASLFSRPPELMSASALLAVLVVATGQLRLLRRRR